MSEFITQWLIEVNKKIMVGSSTKSGAGSRVSEFLSNFRQFSPSTIRTWVWLSALSLLSAGGLLLVSLGYNGTRQGLGPGEWLFWLGFLTLFMPIAARLSSAQAIRGERIGLLVLLGFALYLLKLLHSPVAFTFHDEFVHWRTANDIVQNGHLFRPNPLIPTSALFPGLEIVTASLVKMGGFSIFAAGTIVIGLARLLLILALFLLFEDVSRSARVAGIAALLYMANPSFVFFDAQFSYESLALPIAVFVLFATTRRNSVSDNGSFGPKVAVLIAIVSLVITHHLATYALLALLILWTITFYIPREKADRLSPVVILVFTLVLSFTWLIYVAMFTLAYLSPYLIGAVREIIGMILGEGSGRQLFRSFSGEVTPLWEQLIGYSSVALILLGLPMGLSQFRHLPYKANSFVLALAVGALAYPASLSFRLTYWGVEASNRMSGYLFFPVAIVLAIGVTEFWLSKRVTWIGTVVFTCWVTVIFVGGIIVGWPKWARLPGPYLIAADMRSIEPQGIMAAEWTREFLGSGNRISTDRVNALLMGSYGEQRVVTVIIDGVLVAPVFFSAQVGEEEREILRRGQVQYLIVDRRLSDGLPKAEVYFERGEPDTYRHRTPIDPMALAKFDEIENVSRVFDSGDIVVYDVRMLTDAP